MKKGNVLDAVERLNSTLSKVAEFDVSDVNLSDRVLDNRIITLEGYLRFLESEGIPKIELINKLLKKQNGEGELDDRPDLL
ncbi:hypothetical protein GM661_08355 [Iocasia frigidifontis]|uniref:Uncharacterized protein n=1 Tax=Iocasia fonsfrigidae TaxID=2682810 RepID=A0A8A7KEU5_9FIRM|nr:MULTISPECIES: hypothetical protein [Halanaerobiaceae]AZO95034.1 hypothetical protein D7D81_10780 [Halocella sp. SP3-1]MTI61308.1 hypothetical protein [Bacillota bacterium]QTL97989.1 hypothetical protein GM661_08355 [Iocasia fonsfrigidae]